jgi:formate dehydrogenase maturation protein FdhE
LFLQFCERLELVDGQRAYGIGERRVLNAGALMTVPFCDDCGSAMTLVTEIQRLGTEKGVRFFECAECERSTGVDIDWVPPSRADSGGGMSPLE